MTGDWHARLEAHRLAVYRRCYEHGVGTMWLQHRRVHVGAVITGRAPHAVVLPTLGASAADVAAARDLFADVMPPHSAELQTWAHHDVGSGPPARVLDGWLGSAADVRAAVPTRLPLPPGGMLARVHDDRDVRAFAGVVEAAYRASYGIPAGLQAPLLTKATLTGDDVDAWVLYDPTARAGELRPVRTLAIFRADGIASLWFGATLPGYRRQRIGDSLFAHALLETLTRDVPYIAAWTQPAARSIPSRFGATLTTRIAVRPL
jgi:ribosomal protein S18 acetylase RimI-like enzyme